MSPDSDQREQREQEARLGRAAQKLIDVALGAIVVLWAVGIIYAFISDWHRLAGFLIWIVFGVAVIGLFRIIFR